MKRRKRRKTKRERHILLMAKKARHEAAKRRKDITTGTRIDQAARKQAKVDRRAGILSPILPRILKGGVR